MSIAVFWYRRDLRLNDNAGLYHALKSGLPVLPIFIFDRQILDLLSDKKDKRVNFIYQAIKELDEKLAGFGSSLRVFYGTPFEVWAQLLKEYSIKAVYTNHDYEPYARERDATIAEFLASESIEFHSFKDQCIFERNEVVKDDGKPYTVFTPYSKKWKAKLASKASGFYLKSYPTEKYFDNFIKIPHNELISLEKMGFEKSENAFPTAQIKDEIIRKYAEKRDFPALAATSRLSVHLRFGTVSIRTLARKGLEMSEIWLNELIWRDFYMMILWHFPEVVKENFNRKYDMVAWRNDEQEFAAWCEGKTGYPIVDAGMRELNATGFMHNRVRMVVASFLTKHLLIHWQWGEAYFAEKLLDFDLSANNGGWQWAAGTGTDAQPYFRIFRPDSQQDKFDKNLDYIRRWLPEFGTAAYPKPIVEHSFARERALATYKKGLDER